VSKYRRTWFVVVLFAVAMAWVESASVYYLRVLVDRVQPYQADPLPIHGTIGAVELVREFATLVMLACVGIIGGGTRRQQAGLAAVAFGVWDIFYYVFLRMLDRWPTSLFDWDILFLLPLPWWGPVFAPVCIAALMIVGGTLAARPAMQTVQTRLTSRRERLTGWCLQGAGVALALYVFMADALAATTRGLDPAHTLPSRFNWPLFTMAFALMSAPVAHEVWRLARDVQNRRISRGNADAVAWRGIRSEP
jgi:hypothetical protein